VTLKGASGDAYPVKDEPSKSFRSAAQAWSYIAYNRLRWQRSEEVCDEFAERCAELLEEFGVTDDVLSALAAEEIIEVGIPWDERNYAPRVMPWEFIVGQALTAWDASPFITRHLQVPRRTGAQRRSRRQPSRALVAIGAQAQLEGQYSFESEIGLVTRLFPSAEEEWYDFTIEELAEIVSRKSPDIIHLGGVDNHQGTELFGTLKKTQFDGMVFSDPEGDVKPVKFDELAAALTQGRTKPSVVVFNMYHSAPRSAPTTVALGAGSAIAFQDTCNDLDAERFLGQFYRSWERSKGDLLVSAYTAFQSLKNYQLSKKYTWGLVGSGVVLWSDRSLLTGDVDQALADAEELGQEIAERQQPSKAFANREDARAKLPIVVEPLDDLNYALLHNRAPMFAKLELRNLDEKRTVEDVRLQVELLAGPERLPFASNLQVGNAPLALGDQVFLPLTSTLTRTLRENIRAALRVKMSVGKHDGVYEQTHRVTLLPLNEWEDSDASRQWLPSFIYPMDPAIPRIIAAAEHYLAQLTDVTSSGFDGYQVYDNYEEDEAESLLDAQVEAIWSALVYSLPLKYINPPPTYSEFSQRLRSPSDVLGSGHGTCIDLALLLAAALEYVEIYPVVFLLEGHAFPGYWRSHDAWMNFVHMKYIEDLAGDDEGRDDLESLLLNRRGQPQEFSWLFPKLYRKEIMGQVEEGHLVPLESVWLTNHSQFEDAKDGGWENLSVPDEFHSLIDIRLARECKVTPLPRVES
jgi:hypothetical protein